MSSSLSTFRFDEKLTETLEKLKESTSATTKSEVVRRAIALLKTVQDASEKGDKIILRRDGKDGEVESEREIIIG